MQVTWSIGELATRTGLSVKAIRYYTDVGLLPTAPRSQGGHRRYPPQALEQLQLVRQLRALDVPIAAITDVATGESRLGELVAEQLESTQTQLAELRWREAALQALGECHGPERLRRLHLLARVQRRPRDTADFTRAWQRVLPKSLPPRLADTVMAQAVPELPLDPTPDAVLAYAELHLLMAEPAFLDYWAASHVPDKASMYAALLDASVWATPAVAAGRAPHRCEALDAFCRACARALDMDDTSDFRAFMAAGVQTTVPLIRRYWQHLEALTTAPGPSLGRTHCWLSEGVIAEYGDGRPGGASLVEDTKAVRDGRRLPSA
ncbi:helix-turn-helix domain-containing protein [Streptomyces lasiicapitis]|uniref:helix-turn-helix domain-containing protein n=1 Tax=Streptomyces lasiicapitis TaxID=1923961 RepID=UPI00368D55E9